MPPLLQIGRKMPGMRHCNTSRKTNRLLWWPEVKILNVQNNLNLQIGWSPKFRNPKHFKIVQKIFVLPVFVANGTQPIWSSIPTNSIFSATFTHSDITSPAKRTPVHNSAQFRATSTTTPVGIRGPKTAETVGETHVQVGVVGLVGIWVVVVTWVVVTMVTIGQQAPLA